MGESKWALEKIKPKKGEMVCMMSGRLGYAMNEIAWTRRCIA